VGSLASIYNSIVLWVAIVSKRSNVG